MRITSKGQVTIPQHIRTRCGFLPGTDVDFIVDDDGRVVLVEIDGASRSSKKRTRGQMIVDNMRGRLGTGLSTDELMRLTRDYDADDPGFADPPGAEVA